MGELHFKGATKSINESYFCIRHKNRPKRNQHFKTATPFFLYKHEGKSTPASIMLNFLRISGSDFAYDMLNISFLRKF